MPAVTAEEVEKAIESPVPGQVDLLLDFEWLVSMLGGRPCAVLGEPPFVTHYIFTAPDRFEPFQRENQRGKEYEANPYPLMSPEFFRVEMAANFVRSKPYAITGAWLRETQQKFVEFMRDYPLETRGK